MMQLLLLALPIAGVWVTITGRVTLDSFALGWLLGVLTLLMLRRIGVRFDNELSLAQPVAILLYTGEILWNGLLSSFKVVKLVLSPRINLATGVIALQTGDLSETQLLTALSAHSINTTPGELVIDIADGGVLYVHCLELEASRKVIEQEQARRLALLRRILRERDHE
jgi:multicomponent Na+:H+ antiporter subunit E